MFSQMTKLAIGPLVQIRNFQQVGENVITIETQQRVEIENQRGNRGNEHHVVGQAMQRSRAGANPDKGGDGCEKEFDDHAGSTDEATLPAAPETPARRGVHIWHGCEDHEHHSHDMHFTTEAAAEVGMAKFVQCFDQHQSEIEQSEIARLRECLHPAGAQESKWSITTFTPRPVTISQSSAPKGLMSLPMIGNVLTRKRSGSKSGNLMNMMFIRLNPS